MKLIKFILICILPICSTWAQVEKPVEYRTKNISQIVAADVSKLLFIDIEETPNVKVESIKGSRIVIEITVHLAVPSDAVAKHLATLDRYHLDLVSDIDNDKLIPAPRSTIIMRGKELEEEVSYKIFVPEQMTYHHTQTVSTASLK